MSNIKVGGIFYCFSQVDEKYLVDIFCEVQMEAYDKAVGESFTNLAFEAVEKIINVSSGRRS